ncbi:MAG: large conductance mechanosensitive channel protein MscL [Candidatus Cohnella colombiensis]|uniref:Large-conductance mechanosensitive channel n=1 Tax=Candidatus Cohnella colombiensis TaxID=3121368 RepID=A0AA95JC51_9BACL|nr:MAG: large conductance mechanosensitive channel protein MscL [Cohnella sp.]
MFKSLLSEFKTFAMRGNVVDLAVGVIIGAAFGKIVTSLVNDVIMPPIGKLLGGVNFKDLYLNLDSSKDLSGVSLDKAREEGAAIIAYGQFINVLIDFIIVAFAVFMLIKILNKLTTKKNKDEPAAAPTTRDCPYCLSVIPVAATRCGHCTSEVPEAGAASAH